MAWAVLALSRNQIESPPSPFLVWSTISSAVTCRDAFQRNYDISGKALKKPVKAKSNAKCCGAQELIHTYGPPKFSTEETFNTR